jgi:hypothetical protein
MIQNAIFDNIDAAFVKIGYKPSLIRKDYKYADLFSSGVPVRTVGRAIFGQEPLDYRSACFGIHMAESHRPSKSIVLELKALGAPQIFIVNNGTSELWTITEQEPIFQDVYNTANLPDVIKQNIEDWNPEVIIRAKTGFAKPGPRQLDFVDIGLLPALESEAARKIDILLREILHRTEGELKKNRPPFEPSTIFRIVFSLLAAKLLWDREILNSKTIDFSFPQTALQAVSNHYGPSLTAVASTIPALILKAISEEIGQSFSLRNISVDTLTYIYENTFVSPESRKKLGIHSTPSYVADYVLSQIPIDDLPRPQWHTTDPMSGHGIFLIAAMRRMRTLLPHDWSGRQRHKFFASRLHGVEIDSFSVEVARMCLMLADFPEPNGWDLKNADIFAGKTLENAMARTMILVGNPPFENVEGRIPETPKPIELLRRALPNLPPQAFIGLVLPRSFIDGADYKKERESVLSNFDLVSITALPDRIFLYSDAETAIVVARKQKPESRTSVIFREVRDKDRDVFRIRGQITWEDKVPQSYFKDTMEGRLHVPLLRQIWERLENYSRLGSLVEIKKGVEYKLNIGLQKVTRSSPFHNARPGIAKITENFYQFLAADTVYMSVEKQYRRFEDSKAWNLPWNKPKLVLPASRMSRGPWRYAAAIDNEGRIVTRGFYAAWPKTDAPNVNLLAALLNSPVAAAFVYAHSFQRTIPKRVYEDIPIPEVSSDSEHIICSFVHNYLAALPQERDRAKDILLRIDVEILKLYKLPPRLERKLLNIFWGHQRPVPFEFNGYIPLEIDSWIPLHIYMSEQFREATPQRTMERIPIIHDAAFLAYLKSLGREEE